MSMRTTNGTITYVTCDGCQKVETGSIGSQSSVIHNWVHIQKPGCLDTDLCPDCFRKGLYEMKPANPKAFLTDDDLQYIRDDLEVVMSYLLAFFGLGCFGIIWGLALLATDSLVIGMLSLVMLSLVSGLLVTMIMGMILIDGPDGPWG